MYYSAYVCAILQSLYSHATVRGHIPGTAAFARCTDGAFLLSWQLLDLSFVPCRTVACGLTVRFAPELRPFRHQRA